MADRLRFSRQEVGALTGFGLLLLVTASWWALAFWPTGESASLLTRTREVCFGAVGNGLPDGAGWLALLLQPAIMFALFLLILRDPFELALRRLAGTRAGIGAVASVAGMALIGLTAVGVRVANASLERSDAAEISRSSGTVALARAAPHLGLRDQHGNRITLEELAGAPALVTFGFGHCETVCPAVVHDAIQASRQLAREDVQVAVVVVTLDPWRDVPSRLSAIAQLWQLEGGLMLGGTVAEVERALDDWQVPRARDPRTGDIVHPRLAYVIDGSGNLAFATDGPASELADLVRRVAAGG